MKVERPASKQPIPPEAKRVFKGVIFDVYQWEQDMFDGTKATFEKLRRQDTVVIVPVATDKKILILEQEQPGRAPFLGFPGGRVEEGEDPVTTALRELKEETGYAPKAELELWYATQPVGKIDWAVYVFIARECEPTGKQSLDAGEKISIKLLDFEELVEAITGMYTFDDEMTCRFLRAKYEPAEMESMKKLFGLQ